MHPFIAIGLAIVVATYVALQLILHLTQDKREPRLLESTVPFFDSAIGIFKHRSNYLTHLRNRYHVSIHTLRMPFQRLYVVHTPYLINVIQSKANVSNFIPNLLDFGMLFSGLDKDAKTTLRRAVGLSGNNFTLSVHKYMLSGPWLKFVTSLAVDKLGSSLPNTLQESTCGGLLESIRHELTLAMTGAVYGPGNPFDDRQVESSWCDFVPGINHLLYSPFPNITARKALKARGRVIDAFRRYFETGSHLQAFPMIPEMYETNKRHGLVPDEAAKLEMATSLAMLSSGANTTFWLTCQIFSNPLALQDIRRELMSISREDTTSNSLPRRIVNLAHAKAQCPTLMAILHETLRYHSSVINIKQVQHETKLAGQYLMKKGAIVMIPGQSVHHDKEIWGAQADVFNHLRFLSSDTKKHLASNSAFRPFGAGVTMCPGRHFSTNVILSLVSMIVLQYNITPVEGHWKMPTKRNADIWNAMPKPDWDIDVNFSKMSQEKGAKWEFVWADENEGGCLVSPEAPNTLNVPDVTPTAAYGLF